MEVESDIIPCKVISFSVKLLWNITFSRRCSGERKVEKRIEAKGLKNDRVVGVADFVDGDDVVCFIIL